MESNNSPIGLLPKQSENSKKITTEQKLKKIIATYRSGDMISTKDLNFAIPLLKTIDNLTFLIPEYRLVAQDARRIWMNMEDWLDSRNRKI